MFGSFVHFPYIYGISEAGIPRPIALILHPSHQCVYTALLESLNLTSFTPELHISEKADRWPPGRLPGFVTGHRIREENNILQRDAEVSADGPAHHELRCIFCVGKPELGNRNPT